MPAPTPTPTPAAVPAPTLDADSADIAFTASVRAGRLLFREPPAARVRFTSSPGSGSLSASDRVNLPARVSARTPYREVRVFYVLATASPRRRLWSDGNR